MSSTLLSEIQHRPFPLPANTWNFYQEWRNALFLHWKIPFATLRPLVPEKLNLDSFNGDYYVSLVAFTMKNIRPRLLPAFPPISTFHEINLRTYTNHENKAGVYFLSIEAEKTISAFLARTLSGLPYQKAGIQRSSETYSSVNPNANQQLELTYRIGKPILNKSLLDSWLTERYCLHLVEQDRIYTFDIHHLEWPLAELEIKTRQLHYKVGDLNLGSIAPDSSHYSEGVQVLAWNRV